MAEAHVSLGKKKAVSEFSELIKEYPIVAAVNMEGLPGRQLQTMRAKLRDTCVIRMSKRRLMRVAIEENKSSKKGIEELEPHMKGMPALLFTKENPFTLFKILKQNKSPAPAKGGQTAPNDIIIPAGPTPFAPGPIIGELGKFGLKTGVEGGKVAVKQEKVVVKEGEVISAALAGLLTRLNINPMEVGLDLTAVYENGIILTKTVLDIDEELYMNNLMAAAAGAFNLGVNAHIFNETTTPTIITQAVSQARNLSINEAILADQTVDAIIGRAFREAAGVSSHLPEELQPEELKGLANAPVAEAAPEQTSSKEEPKEDEDDSEPEGDAAAGMGALFG